MSPSLSAAARDNYTTSTPHVSRHALSPRSTLDSLARTTYGGLPNTPRGSLSSMALSPTSNTPYGNIQGRMASYQPDVSQHQSPPFSSQDLHCDIHCEGQNIIPTVHCKIEKGFFMSTDGNWTCYRRNYFSVTASFDLSPYIPNGRLYVQRANKSNPEQIQAFAMSLSAAVDGAAGKNIELVQHTPKRDKGPQNSIRKEKVAPTPPSKSQTDHSYQLGGYGGYAGAQSLTMPYLPLQADPEQQQQQQHQPGIFSSPHASHQANAPPTSHTFERIQFKSATANNGKRRAQQQYYHLIVELWADVRDARANNPEWVKVAQRVSAQVVVRGRSPSHYQNEGPHNAGGTRGPSHGGGAGGAGGGSGMYGLAQPYNAGLGSRGLLSNPPSLGGSLYTTQRGNHHYYMDPSPTTSHSVSSSSSVVGTTDSMMSEQNSMVSSSSEDEGVKAIQQHYAGYRYFPGPLYDATHSSAAAVAHTGARPDPMVTSDDERRGLYPNQWGPLGQCGKHESVESSKGIYPGSMSTSYCS